MPDKTHDLNKHNSRGMPIKSDPAKITPNKDPDLKPNKSNPVNPNKDEPSPPK